MEQTCYCGKPMMLIMTNESYRLWACRPDGCGRLFLQSRKPPGSGTWYLAEMNDRKEPL